MKYLQYVMTGALVLSSVFAKDLPENRSWNNFNFAPKLAADAPAYSLINIGNFGYWQNMMLILLIPHLGIVVEFIQGEPQQISI